MKHMRVNDSDRELLELSAKAAGIRITWHGEQDPWCYAEIFPGLKWNPLTDDGDALRLAVKFKMSVHSGTHSPSGIEFVYAQVRATKPCQEYDLDDRNAATRRAIVRAAAEIGKQMELNA